MEGPYRGPLWASMVGPSSIGDLDGAPIGDLEGLHIGDLDARLACGQNLSALPLGPYPYAILYGASLQAFQ